ncbi:MAG: hypothetical protein NWF04_05735 [Candidatus Bathyarchaeota archaeon]|nr:hypothetical protein [Candidatus Bathyarchaeota archaeon]
MDVTDVWKILTEPQFWPFFLAFLGGYVMMNIFLGRKKVKSFTELERILLAFGLGTFVWFCFFLQPFFIANFWFGILGDGVYSVSAGFFCLVTVVFSPVIKLWGPSDEMKKTVKTLMILDIFCLLVLFLVCCMVLFGLPSYPTGILTLIENSWGRFWKYVLFANFFAILGFYLFWAYFIEGVFTTNFSHRRFIKGKLPKFLRYLKNRSSKSALISLLVCALMIMGLLAAPWDLASGFFTPAVHEETQMCLEENSFVVADRIVYLNATWIMDNRIDVVTDTYCAYLTSYLIKPPSFPWGLKEYYIENPSNASFLLEDKPSPHGHYTPALSVNWPKLGIIVPPAVSTTVSYQTGSESEIFREVSSIVLSFADFTEGSFSANLTYYQQVESEGLALVYHDRVLQELEDGNWLETQYIDVENTSNESFYIPGLWYNKLSSANSSQVYNDGKLWVQHGLYRYDGIAMDMGVEPQSTKNITIHIMHTVKPE